MVPDWKKNIKTKIDAQKKVTLMLMAQLSNPLILQE